MFAVPPTYTPTSMPAIFHHSSVAPRKYQPTRLAALVDHYFAAWQETRLQLERRDRELAEVRRARKPQVVSLQR